MNMKLGAGILGCTLASLAALSSANAADMYGGPVGGGYKDGPSYAVINWSGFYAGINGGGAWSDSSDQLAAPGYFGGLSPSGGFGGGQIGYNWQGIFHPHIVVGIEVDIQGAGISDKGFDYNGYGIYKSELDYFGTVRGRIGYALDTSLIYFTGGFAYGGIKNVVNWGGSAPGADGYYVKDTTATGYVLGAGWEYKFSPAWSAKIEYQYINLGKNDPVDVSALGNGPYTANGGIVHDDAFHTVRAGINYFFAPAYAPLK
jgi:outer membrane immunogenic protein